MKFVHAADLHVDSPLRGLEAYPGAPAERVRLSTRQALARLVQVCLHEQAEFLVVAGDLFDQDWSCFNTALYVVQQLQILDRANIPVFVIRGNHDSYEGMSRRMPWPKNVHVFDHLQAQTHELPDRGVALHGLSYARRKLPDNLVPVYPPARRGLFNIGLLHTNATGNPHHDSYAPCNVEQLVDKGYQYWALGHVHERQVLHTAPHVVYSGNTQGRHIREAGEKGCAVVTVEGQVVKHVEFVSTDVLRWQRATVVLEADETLDDLYDRMRAKLRHLVDDSAGRMLAIRLEVQGRCAGHRDMVTDGQRQEAVAQLRSLPGEFTDEVWIEKVLFGTRPLWDRDALAQGQDLIGELLRDIDQVDNDERVLKEMADELATLRSKVGLGLGGESNPFKEIDFDEPAQLRAWLQQAEVYLLDSLMGADA